MSDRRLIQIWYDVNTREMRNSPSGNGVRIENAPNITFREKPVVNIQLVTDSDLTAYTSLLAAFTYEAAIDKDFSSALLMCKTLNTGFNQTDDWYDETPSGSPVWAKADPALGQLSVRLNASTTGYQEKIGTDAELLSTKLEIQAKDASNNLISSFAMPFRCLNLINDSGDVPDEYSANFEWFDDPVTGKQCLRIVNDDGEVLKVLAPMGA